MTSPTIRGFNARISNNGRTFSPAAPQTGSPSIADKFSSSQPAAALPAATPQSNVANLVAASLTSPQAAIALAGHPGGGGWHPSPAPRPPAPRPPAPRPPAPHPPAPRPQPPRPPAPHPQPPHGGGPHPTPAPHPQPPHPPAPHPQPPHPPAPHPQPPHPPAPHPQPPHGGGHPEPPHGGGPRPHPPVVISSGGHRYHVPDGGWVTHQQQHHPDMPTWVCDRDGWRHDGDWRHDPDDWCRDRWGGGWHDGYRGFYCGDNFWYGFEMGQLASWNYQQPIYVVSPITGDPCGTLPAPDPNTGLGPQQQAYLDELSLMANPQQDPNNPDGTAGLYQLTPNFDPNNPGGKLDAATAFNMLNSSQPLYFHPPNGDWEQLNQLSDLDAYLYTQEQRDQAPAQTVETPPDPSKTPPPDVDTTPEPSPAPAASQPAPEHWWQKVGDWVHNTF